MKQKQNNSASKCPFLNGTLNQKTTEAKTDLSSDNSKTECPYTQDIEKTATIIDPLNFDWIARNAIKLGIFEHRDQPVTRPKGSKTPLPDRPLDIPYPNGPMVIERREEDVPVDTMKDVRRNIILVTQLLMPNDSVNAYFEQQLKKNEDPDSPQLQKAISDIYGGWKDYGYKTTPNVESFDFDSPDRKVANRNLYTPEELKETNKFAIKNPETVLSIALFRSIMQQYLAEAIQAFKNINEPDLMSSQDIEDLEKYAGQWATNNFNRELMPALAMIYKNKGETELDQEDFAKAFGFIKDNGAFDNHVKVSKHVAGDKKARVNEFHCPAMFKLNNLLSDGTLLFQAYEVTREAVAQGHLSEHIRTIRSKVSNP